MHSHSVVCFSVIIFGIVILAMQLVSHKQGISISICSGILELLEYQREMLISTGMHLLQCFKDVFNTVHGTFDGELLTL